MGLTLFAFLASFATSVKATNALYGLPIAFK